MRIVCNDGFWAMMFYCQRGQLIRRVVVNRITLSEEIRWCNEFYVSCLPPFYEFLKVRMLVTATLSSFRFGEILGSRFGNSLLKMNEVRIIQASEVWQISYISKRHWNVKIVLRKNSRGECLLQFSAECFVFPSEENACYHSVRNVVSSRMTYENVKIIQISILRVVYVGTWSVVIREEYRLRVVEKNVLKVVLILWKGSSRGLEKNL
jgi:hypothetical protein